MSNIVERLRSPANVFYEYAADNGAFLREAADEITRLRAENERLREENENLKAANRYGKDWVDNASQDITRLRADLAAVTAERNRMR